MKNRCPSEKNTRVIRINVGTYELLRELSQTEGLTLAEAVDFAITRRRERELKVSPAQIPMAAFRISPAPSVIAVNGAKHSAYVIKPKGGIIHE